MFLPDLPGPRSQVDALSTPTQPQAEPAPVLQRSRGCARLRVACESGQDTRLARLFQEGCLKVRLPRPEVAGAIDAVLINTAGGLTGGDELRIEVDVAEGARATVTTPACERIYRSIGGEARIDQCLQVGRGGRLDWVPQETILFDRSRLRRRFDVRLAGDAEVTLSEALLFGRAAMGESMRSGLLSDFWTIRRDGRLLIADAVRVADPFDSTLASPATLHGRIAIATLLHVGQDLEAKRDALRSGFAGGPATAAASVVAGVLLARIVAADSRALRDALVPALHVVRERRPLPRNWLC